MKAEKRKLCDYETCQALVELGFKQKTMLFKKGRVIQAPTLLDAQWWIYEKWGDWVTIPKAKIEHPLEMLQLCIFLYLRNKIS